MTHKGIYYYATYAEANTVRAGLLASEPAARIVAYELGYAIQREAGSRYWGTKGWV